MGIVVNTGNQMTINTDLSKIFIGGNRSDSADHTNSTYDDYTIVAGTLLGKVGATGEVVPLASGATDGSQYPIGILMEDAFVAAGDTANVTYCVAGDVAQEQVILDGSDTMDTLISNRSIHDRIGGDTVGIKLVTSVQNTDFDNS